MKLYLESRFNYWTVYDFSALLPMNTWPYSGKGWNSRSINYKTVSLHYTIPVCINSRRISATKTDLISFILCSL
jgi:hypothetical protein